MNDRESARSMKPPTYQCQVGDARKYHVEFRPAIVMTKCAPRHKSRESLKRQRYSTSRDLGKALDEIRVDHLKPLLGLRQLEADFAKIANKYEAKLEEEERLHDAKKARTAAGVAVGQQEVPADGDGVADSVGEMFHEFSHSALHVPPIEHSILEDGDLAVLFDQPLDLHGSSLATPAATVELHGSHMDTFRTAHTSTPAISLDISVSIDHQTVGIEPKWYWGEEEKWMTSSSEKVTFKRRPTSLTEDFGQREVIARGTYGSVDFAIHKQTGKHVAIKTLLAEKSRTHLPEGKGDHHFGYLREVDLLVRLRHPNVVELLEAFAGDKEKLLYIVMEYIPYDMHEIVSYHGSRLDLPAVKQLAFQLFTAMEWLHANGVVHRDIKLANLLYSDGVLKVADFGISRRVAPTGEPMSPKVVTRYFRAPELLIGETQYTTAIDVWGCGMVIAAWCLRKHIAAGATSGEQMNRIVELLGTVPTARQWPRLEELKKSSMILNANPRSSAKLLAEVLKGARVNLSKGGSQLIMDVLRYRPEDRLTASNALASFWFRSDPLPTPIRNMFRLAPPMTGQRTKKGRGREHQRSTQKK